MTTSDSCILSCGRSTTAKMCLNMCLLSLMMSSKRRWLKPLSVAQAALRAARTRQRLSVSKLKLPPRSKKRSVVLAAQRGARTRKHLSVSKLKLLQRSRKKSVVLDRRAPGGIKAIQEKLKRQLVGWAMYYGNAIPKAWQAEIDQWIRRRIRQLHWKQWKTPQNRQRQCARRWRRAPSIGEFAYSTNSY